MSSPEFVQPEDVVRERNFIRRIENALGVSEDFEGDDTMLAALVANSYRQGLLLQTIAGQGLNIEPDVDVSIDSIDIADEAIREALASIPRIQIYNSSTSASDDDILSQDIRPTTDHSQFRVSVTLDTGTTFSVRTKPNNESNITETLNGNSSLVSGSRYEFDFETDIEAEYNFRAGTSLTVENLRVMEMVV